MIDWKDRQQRATRESASLRRKLLNPFDLGLRVDFRPGAASQRQVVHVEGILRAHIAAGDAVATVRAGLLVNPVRVLAINAEIHVDVERVGVIPEFHRAPLHGLHFGQFHRVWDAGSTPAPAAPAGNRASGRRG